MRYARAVHTATTASGGNTTVLALFIGRDYQGSITELIGEDGALVQSYSYDPWGRPRDAQTLEQYRCDGTSSSGGSAPAFLLGRGYTGHEWLPWFALYNCNARLYDPLLGRFLEPDPYVQAPDFTQNFNRFAYCLNNPLKYTDESGEFIFSLLIPGIGAFIDAACWGAVIGGATYTASIAMSKGGFNNWSNKQFWNSVGWGAISGAVTFGVGEIFSDIGNVAGKFGTEMIRGVTHGLVQGEISAFRGGDFGSAFLSGMLGSYAASGYSALRLDKWLGNTGDYVFGALSGGIGSSLSGGDFWEGAANGIMVTGLNHLQQHSEGNKFCHRLLRHYINGSGETFYLSEQEFKYLLSRGIITTELPKLFEGNNYANISFYESESDLLYSFGTGTVSYTISSDGIREYLGFHDYYNFDPKPWGSRSIQAEIITRAANTFFKGTNFHIYYNYSSFVLPSTAVNNHTVPWWTA